MVYEILLKLQRFSKTKYFNWVVFLLFGVGTYFAFAPHHITPLIWFSPLTLFYLEEKYRFKKKSLLWAGIFAALSHYAVAFHYNYYMFTVFGEFPAPLAVVLFIISGIVTNLKIPIFLFLFRFWNLHVKSFLPLGAGLCGILSEFFIPQVFPWYWGNIVSGNLILAQTAEYFGPYGMSILLFIVSYSIYAELKKFLQKTLEKQTYSFDWKPNLFAASFLFFFFALGLTLYFQWNQVSPKGETKVLVIQPNAPLEFHDGRGVMEVLDTLMKTIEKLANEGSKEYSPDLVVLPESAIPFFSSHKSEETVAQKLYWERFDALTFLLSRNNNTNLFLNEIDARLSTKSQTPETVFLNSSVLVAPDGKRKESYQKRYLMMFGEAMPFEFLYAFSPNTSKFEPGDRLEAIHLYQKMEFEKNPSFLPLTWEESKYFSMDAIAKRYESQYISSNKKQSVAKEDSLAAQVNASKKDVSQEKEKKENSNLESTKTSTKFLPFICYEYIIPEYIRSYTGPSPDFFVNITNDKWYGDGIESFQHNELGRLRAIEHRKWVVRSTNSGVSLFVDHMGRVVNNSFTGRNSVESMFYTVPHIPSEFTFYKKFGNLLTWILIAIGLGVGVWKKFSP